MPGLTHAGVLGAGIQGVCVTLALRSLGYRVTLVDQSPHILHRASQRNEGKIHLGFVYAKDPSMRTSALMLEGALGFANLLDRWTGAPIDWPILLSHRFVYCVAADSLLRPDELLAHYDMIDQIYADMRRDPRATYFGRRPDHLWRPSDGATTLPGLSRRYATPLIDTEEVALDLPRFHDLLRDRLDEDPGVTQLLNHRVTSVARTARGFRTSGRGLAGESWHLDSDLVVNCLWDGRLAIDRTMGIEPRRSWVFRLKYRVAARLPETLRRLPALTFVLGPYGDIVSYPGGSSYLSYYPVCLRGWSRDVAPPREWEAACEGTPNKVEADQVARLVLERLNEVLPGLDASTVKAVDAGVIFTWGDTDISDPDSALHQRFDTGVMHLDGYFSIDTGKYTTAPLFAEQLAARLGSQA